MLRLLDGKAMALTVRERVRKEVQDLARAAHVPGLAVVLVGDDPASQVYVRNKDRAAREAGIEARTLHLAASTRQTELEARISELNQDPSVHGILVQLPLPAGLDAGRVVRAIDPAKDVDGLHPENVAALAMGSGAGLVPCTPAGCLEILDQSQIPLAGSRVVVLGRSQLVGKPLALLCLQRDATVTIAHSKTRDLPQLCAQADILCAAVGRPELVRGSWIRPGACVIDVGINRLASGKLVGDVAFDEARLVAGWLTPVPGGVGPMTIAMLLENTLRAAQRAFAKRSASTTQVARARQERS